MPADSTQAPRKVSPGFPPGFRTEEVLVTPDMARKLLEQMHKNRTLSRVEVSVHEQNLVSGNWFPEISPVYLDASGLSWDAQHRLQAVINTGISAWMLFLFGVREIAAEYIDTGRKRLYADNLKRRGVDDYKRQSVVAKYIALYELYGMDGVRNPSKHAVAQSVMDEWIDADGVLDSIHVGEMLYRAVGANPSWASYAAYRTGKGQDPDGFWRNVARGDELKHGDPALTLHNWLMQGKKRDRRPADKRLMELYGLTTAWNKHVLGQRYASVSPRFEERRDGKKFFPASNVPDFLALAPGTYDRTLVPGRKEDLEQLRDAFSEARR